MIIVFSQYNMHKFYLRMHKSKILQRGACIKLAALLLRHCSNEI